MMSEQWLVNRVQYIKGLKNPSATQKTLVELYEIPEGQRTPTNTKHLTTLIKAERAAEVEKGRKKRETAQTEQKNDKFSDRGMSR